MLIGDAAPAMACASEFEPAPVLQILVTLFSCCVLSKNTFNLALHCRFKRHNFGGNELKVERLHIVALYCLYSEHPLPKIRVVHESFWLSKATGLNSMRLPFKQLLDKNAMAPS